MCFQVRANKLMVRLADKPIRVKKLVYPKKVGEYESFYKGFEYVRGEKLPKIELVSKIKCSYKIMKDCNVADYYYVIDEGYHSYSEKCKFLSYKVVYHSEVLDFLRPDEISLNPVFIDFIIPEGTIYYENEIGEIVSSDLYLPREDETY